MIEIRHRYTQAVLYRSETAMEIRECLEMAAEAKADLFKADLTGADLTGADLTGADLTGANLFKANLSKANLFKADLRGADLYGADLYGAYLREADLREADLRKADLTGADLTGVNLRRADLSEVDLYGADLRGADLSETYLSRADLRGADLREADLRGADLRRVDLREVKEDIRKILDSQPAEASGLLKALKEGRVDGSTYEGECACLVGTIANVAHVDYTELAVRPDSSRPAEIFFLGISKGDTPETNPIARLAAEWIEEWLSDRERAAPKKSAGVHHRHKRSNMNTNKVNPINSPVKADAREARQ